MPRGSHAHDARRWIARLALAGLCAAGASAATEGDAPADPASALDAAIAAAEARLQGGDLNGAEGLYREALFHGWLLTASLEKLDHRAADAREAVRNAALFRVESGSALQALAAAQLQLGDSAGAVETLEALVAKDAGDGESRRLQARALATDGKREAAAQRLAEAAALSADDPEAAFLVGIEYLGLKKVREAEALFARVLAARPIPQTHVLVGRAWRDAGEYDRARTELQAALRQDPAVRRAHYYLGMVALADARIGPERLDRAMAEFREELKRAPEDPAANDQLGLALLEAGRAAEALPALEAAVRAQGRALHLLHLGRCLLALDRPAEAASALRRALEQAEEHGGGEAEIGTIHYQLGLALRKLGAAAEAASHLAEAGRRAAQRGPDEAGGPAGGGGSDDPSSPLAELSPWQRQGLQRRARAGLVRAYFNLGVLQAQARGPSPAAERFTRAAAFFERAAALDPDFPQVQSALGVARFNARDFAKATAPLALAVTARPDDRGLKRMLATSWLNTDEWAKAAALLEDDPERESDASLQFAYGLALLRSGRAAGAEEILTRGAAARRDSSDLLVLLGQARIEQGKDDDAVRDLQQALALDASASQAHGTLGRLYLRQGRLDEAEAELRAELQAHPADAAAQRDLDALALARAAREGKAQR